MDKWVANQGAKATVSVPIGAGQGGRFYILVGNEHAPQHQNSRFDVTLVDLFDANSGRDAGSDDANAIDIQPGAYTGYVHANDATDFYALNVTPTSKYNVRVKPGVQEKEIDLEVLDRDGVKMKEVEAANAGAAVRVENIEFPYEGKAYLKVKARAVRRPRMSRAPTRSRSRESGATRRPRRARRQRRSLQVRRQRRPPPVTRRLSAYRHRHRAAWGRYG